MAKFYRFTVEGSMEFPWDMLRYDGCYPASNAHVLGGFGDNVLNLALHHADCTGDVYTGLRQVELIKPCDGKQNCPTEGRWNSFGWKIVKIQYVTT